MTPLNVFPWDAVALRDPCRKVAQGRAIDSARMTEAGGVLRGGVTVQPPRLRLAAVTGG